MALVVAFLILLLAAPAVTAMQYVVGDKVGWNTLGDYAVWSAGKTFTIGDTLVFNNESKWHTVDEVSQVDYQTCTAGNALISYGGGRNIISLDKPGPIYFMCPTPGHCYRMRLAINVVGSTNTSPVVDAPPTAPFNSTPVVPTCSTPTVPTCSTPTVPAGSTPTVPGPINSSSICYGAIGTKNWLMVKFSLLLGLVLGLMS